MGVKAVTQKMLLSDANADIPLAAQTFQLLGVFG